MIQKNRCSKMVQGIIFSEDIPIIFSEDILRKEFGKEFSDEYVGMVKKIKECFKDPKNATNYCGYYQDNNKQKYLLIPQKICKTLNQKICKTLNRELCNSGDNNRVCDCNCPIKQADRTIYRDLVRTIYRDLVRNYESFFEAFLREVLQNFWKLSPYIFPVEQIKLYLKSSPIKTESDFKPFLLLTCAEEIKKACHAIMESPHMILSKENSLVPVSNIRQIYPEMLIKAVTKPQYLIETPYGQGMFHNASTQKSYSFRFVTQTRKKEHFDTFENRTIKFNDYYTALCGKNNSGP